MFLERKNKVLNYKTYQRKEISILATYEIFENTFFIYLETLVLSLNHYNSASNGSFFVSVNGKRIVLPSVLEIS